MPVGLGQPLFDKLDADIAFAMMGIHAVKGVEIGAGFASVAQHGTTHGDSLKPGAEAMPALVVMEHALRHRARCGDVRSGLAPLAASAGGAPSATG